ncbi:hypothetical protein AAVH_27450 [Aphelenchoides avenae]|nr:hypothetical protein AAVH_27450 [Aphelenchus avenae]
MDADEVVPEELFLSKIQQSPLPTAFSEPDNIHGHAAQWHKIHADIISEMTFDDETNTYNCYAIIHDSARSIQLELCNVPEKAVPRLTVFTELILVGIISGDDDTLKTCVTWEHTAFVEEQDTSTESISATSMTAKPSDMQTSHRNGAEIQVIGEFAPSTAALQVTTPSRIPQVDLSKVKREQADGTAADKPGNPRRRPPPKTERASTRNAKKPKNDAEKTMNGEEAQVGNNSAPVTSSGGNQLPHNASLGDSVESEKAEDDAPDQSCIE